MARIKIEFKNRSGENLAGLLETPNKKPGYCGLCTILTLPHLWQGHSSSINTFDL